MIKIFSKKKKTYREVESERWSYGTIWTDQPGVDIVELLVDAQWNARLALQDTLNKERLTSYKTRSIHHHTFGCV